MEIQQFSFQEICVKTLAGMNNLTPVCANNFWCNWPFGLVANLDLLAQTRSYSAK